MKLITKYQEGGQMTPAAAPAEGAAPAPEMQGQGNAEEQLAALAEQLVQMLMQNIGDPQAVAAVLQMALEMVQGAAQQAPVFKCGGKMVKKAKKACGGKMKK